MKATGIVRRLDELGRVVIPKEIRKTLRLSQGDPIEIFTDTDGILLKKYSPIRSLDGAGKGMADVLAECSGHTAVIVDTDVVVGASAKDFEGKNITKKLEEIIRKQKTVVLEGGEDGSAVSIAGEENKFTAQLICPIVAEGDSIGACILLAKDGERIRETDLKLVKLAAGVIASRFVS